MEEQLFGKAYDELVEEDIKKLLEENLSLIEANAGISTEDSDELSDIELYDNEDDKLDEAVGGTIDIVPNASQDTITKDDAVELAVAKIEEKRSSGPQVEKCNAAEPVVVANHVSPDTRNEKPKSHTDGKQDSPKRPWAGILKKKNPHTDGIAEEGELVLIHRNDSNDNNNKSYGGAKPRPSRLSLFLGERGERSIDNNSEDTGEGQIQKIVKKSLALMEPNSFFTSEDPDEIKKIELSDDEDSKFDEAVGGEIDTSLYSCQDSVDTNKGNRRQVTWGGENSLTPNHVQAGSKSKHRKSVSGTNKLKKNEKSKKKKGTKAKKSRFSCLIRCFNPKVDHDDENDGDDSNKTSVPRAAIRGNIEDNMFDQLFIPVALINGFKVKLVNNVQPTQCYFFKTDGIFYAFSNSVYLKMEIILTKKISLRPAGQFSLFINNPNNKPVNEIVIDYNVIDMPDKSMLISRQTKFDPSSNKKIAVLDLRSDWYSR